MKKFIIHILPAILIILAAAYLRMYRIPEYMTFLGDEGRDVLVVKRMIVDGKWTLLGPTASVGGFFMGPIYYYFMLPFLWLWNLDPVGPAVMVAAIGVISVFLVYLFGKRMFSERIGIFASSLYALSPVVIAHSRSSWNPNIVPFFSILLFYILWSIGQRKKFGLLFVVGIICGIGVQLHYTFLFLCVVSGLWILWIGGISKRMWKYWGLVILGFIVGFSPFLAFEIRHQFSNTQAILRFVFAGKDTGFDLMHFVSNSIIVLYQLFGRLVLHLPDANKLASIPGWQRIAWQWGTSIVAVASIGVLLVKQKCKQKMYASYVIPLMLLWLAVILFFFGLYKKPIYDYYLGICFAIPFFSVGILFDTLYVHKWGKWIAVLCYSFLVLLNWQGRPFRFIPNNQLGQTKQIAREVLEKTEGKPYNFALLSSGNSDHAYRYFLEIWGQPPVTIENPTVDPERKTVTDQLLIICEYPSCEPIGNPLWEVAGFGRAEVTSVWDVSVVKLYKLIHYQGGQDL